MPEALRHDWTTGSNNTCNRCKTPKTDAVLGTVCPGWRWTYVPPQETAPRPTPDATFLEMAAAVAKRSTCARLQVGCIITNFMGTNIVSMGYNGSARGLPNGCERLDPGNCGCLHAEENALLKAPYDAPLVLYTTHSPCGACARRVLNSKVIRVVYGQLYRDATPLKLLYDQGITVIHPRLNNVVPPTTYETAIKAFKEMERELIELQKQTGGGGLKL